MQVQFEILRMDRQERIPYRQHILFDIEDENATVATALTKMNEDPDLKDMQGNPVRPVEWECSCLQKKCGACAMRINGHPCLACDTKLSSVKDYHFVLEPLRKFPVVADLIVDRSIMYENLKTIGVWLRDTADLKEKKWDMAYEGSRCLQCGCCLEICPNYYAGGTFAGTAGFVPTARLISELTGKERRDVRNAYRKYIYNGCGKSLACRDICPAGIDVESLLVNSNAIAVWKRR